MATITGLTAARMAAIEAASVISGVVNGDNLILTQFNGTTINAGNVRGPIGPIGPAYADKLIVTALPASPVNGQECFYLADSGNGIVWHLKFRSGSASAHKWEYVGGPPTSAASTGGSGIISSSTIAVLTNTPQISIPLPGVYDIELYIDIQSHIPGGNDIRVYFARSTASTTPLAGGSFITLVGTYSGGSIQKRNRITGLAAGNVIQLGYASTGGTAFNQIDSGILRATPVRVG